MVTDQATRLRQMAAQLKQEARRKPVATRPRTIAVTSGKGGVGKTNLSLNLAIAASRLGHRVVLLDADLGLANVDVLANLQARYNVSHVISGVRGILDVVVEGPAGVQIVPGAAVSREFLAL
jgi:flagellar biosynthesis protein FlhG